MTNELLLVAGERIGRESTMESNEKHRKIIAIGLVPVFLSLAFILPDTTGDSNSPGGMLTAMVVSLTGMSIQRKDAQEPEDLLAVPPRKP